MSQLRHIHNDDDDDAPFDPRLAILATLSPPKTLLSTGNIDIPQDFSSGLERMWWQDYLEDQRLRKHNKELQQELKQKRKQQEEKLQSLEDTVNILKQRNDDLQSQGGAQGLRFTPAYVEVPGV